MQETDTRRASVNLADIETWIFDLDNTLYRTQPEMMRQVGELMRTFIEEFLGIDADEAYRVQKEYFVRYGLTLRGLMLEHGLDPQEYDRYLSRTDLSGIQSNPLLAERLGQLPGRRIIYTNAFTDHTREVLERIGISHLFDAIFDISDADYLPKPDIVSYRRLCEMYGVDPTRSAMVEDIARNLEPAAQLGMTTVWVRTGMEWSGDPSSKSFVDYETDDLEAWLAMTAARQPSAIRE